MEQQKAVSSVLFRLFFFWPWFISYTRVCSDQCSENSGKPSVDLQSCPSLEPSPLWSCLLCALTTVASQTLSSAPPLRETVGLGLSFHLCAARPGISPGRVQWCLWTSPHLSPLSEIPVLCSLMSKVKKRLFHHLVQFLSCFRWDRKSSPCHSTLGKS